MLLHIFFTSTTRTGVVGVERRCFSLITNYTDNLRKNEYQRTVQRKDPSEQASSSGLLIKPPEAETEERPPPQVCTHAHEVMKAEGLAGKKGWADSKRAQQGEHHQRALHTGMELRKNT